jgi:DNA cross-link repair 1C protein
MAFVEGHRGNMLFTGDFRLPINCAPRLKFLNKYTTSSACATNKNYDDQIKQIDYLYIDATFFKKNVKVLPSREESCTELINFLQDFLRKEGAARRDFLAEKKFVYLKTSARIGYEYIYQEIYARLTYKTHVNYTIYQLYDKLPQIQRCLTLDPYETPIHSCIYELKKRDLKRGILIKKSVDVDNKITKPGPRLPCTCSDFDHRTTDIVAIKIILSTMWFVDTNYFEKLLVNYVPKPTESDSPLYKPYKLIYRLLYSFHSSFNEIVDFVNHLKPVNIKVIALPESVKESDIHEFFYGLPVAKNKKQTVETSRVFSFEEILLKKRKSALNMNEVQTDTDDDDDDGFNFGDEPNSKNKKNKIFGF